MFGLLAFHKIAAQRGEGLRPEFLQGRSPALPGTLIATPGIVTLGIAMPGGLTEVHKPGFAPEGARDPAARLKRTI